jgi:hypothetical protein
MTPHLAEIIAAMLDAKLDAEAGSNAAQRGTIGSRRARAPRHQPPPAGRGAAARRGGRR